MSYKLHKKVIQSSYFMQYWICLHTNLVETINGRENMIPAIGRWDITKIHKAIRDIRVEEIEVRTNGSV